MPASTRDVGLHPAPSQHVNTALQLYDGIGAASQADLGTLGHKGGACHLQFQPLISHGSIV